MDSTLQTQNEPQPTQIQDVSQTLPPPPDHLLTHTTTPQPNHRSNKKAQKYVLPVILTIAILATSLVSSISIYSVYNLNVEVTTLQSQIETLQSTLTANYATTTTSYTDTATTSLSTLYSEVETSVVTIECTITQYVRSWGRQTATTATAQGSGFVYQFNGKMIIITNNHVIEDATAIKVIFADGNTYDVELLGSDSVADLAILSCNAPTSEYYPLEIVSSSNLSVGEAVAAIGSPYGLAGTMTTGIISALDRTITVTEDTGLTYDMTGLIQTSAPINSGNSGGPLMTYSGQVIGITTAIVSNSDGLGFAVPSDTILTVINELLT